MYDLVTDIYTFGFCLKGFGIFAFCLWFAFKIVVNYLQAFVQC